MVNSSKQDRRFLHELHKVPHGSYQEALVAFNRILANGAHDPRHLKVYYSHELRCWLVGHTKGRG